MRSVRCAFASSDQRRPWTIWTWAAGPTRRARLTNMPNSTTCMRTASFAIYREPPGAGIRTISLSLGRCSPSRACARGASTARLCAVRMRRSRSERCPSRLARRARRSVSSRAARMDAVWRAYTIHVVARKATSQTATQWRPLIIGRHLEGAETGGPGARVVAHFYGRGTDRLLREHATERAAATGAHRLPGRAHAGAAPIAKRLLADTVLARVVGDHRQAAAGLQRRAQRGQRELQLLELLIDHDPERLEQAREIGRSRARTPCLANRVHKIVAGRER